LGADSHSLQMVRFLVDFATSVYIILLEIFDLLTMPVHLLMRSFEKDRKFSSIFITGASRGIGEAVAVQYAKPGATLFLSARSEGKLTNVKKICEAKGAKVHVFPADVCDKERMKTAIEEADKIQELDLIIANAGMDDFHRPNLVVDVNCNGLINTVLPAYELMKKRKKGHICLLGSVSSFFGGWKQEDCYGATKMFVLGYGRALRARFQKYKIGVTVVCPGLIITDMTTDLLKTMNKTFTGSLIAKGGLTPKQCAEHIDYANRRNFQDYIFPWFYYLICATRRSAWRRGGFVC